MVDAIADTWPSRKYGTRLMPELYEHLHSMPYEKAVHVAEKLAADLRAEGYADSKALTWYRHGVDLISDALHHLAFLDAFCSCTPLSD
jgi:hypothetical protein